MSPAGEGGLDKPVSYHACLGALFPVTLNGRGRHGYDGKCPYASNGRIRPMVTDEMGRSIAVKDGHLTIHEDDIWFWVGGAGSF